ncbi:HNH endonuclease signature motif containing protein [Janibacter limosus]|uniref:HNH endonuclease signature motif containing protein n=1 Tax=Janibacter limosus TaxID=53458 RepID=UPI0008306DE4|nr:HNH endonuclease signature motif containing protein [Janibacter limosus]
MSEATVRYADPGLLPGLRDALRALMRGDVSTIWQVPDSDVGEVLALVGQIRQRTERAEVAAVREGVSRGLPTQESWSVRDWVGVNEGRRAPRPSVRHVGSVVRVAEASLRTGSGLSNPDPTPNSDTGEEASSSPAAGVSDVVAAFADGCLPLGKADQLVRFEEGVRRVADPDLLADDLGILLGHACDDEVFTGPQGRTRVRVSGLDDKKLAAAITMTARMLRPDKDLRDEDERQKASRSLTQHTDGCGMTRYKLVLDPEGAAIIDAAVAALSAPVKGPEGALDERTPARRRADALLSVVGRGVSSPGEAPKTDKAQVIVTISLAALTANLTAGQCGACGQDLPTNAFGQPLTHVGDLGGGAGHGLGAAGVAGGGHAGGLTATGQVLAPAVVRKMACEGAIIPALLGTDSEPLELGRAARYFTPGQKRALYLRDGGCTFPGCTMPAHWSDAHHVDYWSMGGLTDIDNAALLCERHHTTVHTHDLTCTITAAGVTWHV